MYALVFLINSLSRSCVTNKTRGLSECSGDICGLHRQAGVPVIPLLITSRCYRLLGCCVHSSGFDACVAIRGAGPAFLRLLMPCTELNVGQGYFLKSFVLAAGRSLGVGVQSNTSCESCSLPQVSRVLFSTIPVPLHAPGVRAGELVPSRRAGSQVSCGDTFALCPCRAGCANGMAAETPSRPMLGALRLALSQQLGCPGGEEECPHVILLQNRTRPAKMVIPCACCSPRGRNLGPFFTEHPRRAAGPRSHPVPRSLPVPLGSGCLPGSLRSARCCVSCPSPPPPLALGAFTPAFVSPTSLYRVF
ncbi:uncharacterized protein LOC143169825 [Aptenodytes patagonicus]|uniref:uncharacterized protein LOC143169825 n=1 Tax=Aptenodytes patagonicus TaxID=9234 RepID=UPI003FA01720